MILEHDDPCGWFRYAEDAERGWPLLLLDGLYSLSGDGDGWGQDNWIGR